MRHPASPLRAHTAIAALALALCTAEAAAQRPQTRFEDVPPERLVDWYYASTFGTGAYRIGDRTVFVGRLPLSWKLQESGEKQWGIKLKMPVSVGVYDVSSAFSDILASNYGTLTVLPGVEFEKRVNPRWKLRPTASLGYGHDAANGVGATVWEAGVRSLYSLPMPRTDLEISSAVLFAGYESRPARQQLGILGLGLGWILPTGKDLLGQPTNLGLHFNYYLYFDRLDFFLDPEGRRTVPQQFELALTLGTYQPLKILGFETDRIGVAIRGGEGLLAIRLVSGFLF